MASKTVLFIVNGLGLGNSTRCHAIIQHLASSGVDVAVTSSGNGLWYFQDCDDIKDLYEIKAFHYGKKDGAINILSTFSSFAELISLAKKNSRTISSILDRLKPNAVICDSVYTFQPMKARHITLFSLNNADVVVHTVKHATNVPRSVIPQYRFIEYPDYLFNRLIPDMVLSPSLNENVPTMHKNIRRFAPIIRNNLAITPTRNTDRPKRVVIMLSGSTFGTNVDLSGHEYPFKIDIVGRERPDSVCPSETVTYHGRVKHNAAILEHADIAVVNGGFSAVSEMFCMEKPLVVIPVPNHAEQWANAYNIEKLGVGFMASESNYTDIMCKVVDKFDFLKQTYRNLNSETNGAEVAAATILEAL